MKKYIVMAIVVATDPDDPEGPQEQFVEFKTVEADSVAVLPNGVLLFGRERKVATAGNKPGGGEIVAAFAPTFWGNVQEVEEGPNGELRLVN